MKKWTTDDSKELYNINGWGTSYFGINDEGNVYVTPCKDGTQIDLREVMDELSLRDVQSPVLLRFPDILDNRIEKTWSCFKKAAEQYEYKAENYVVFPIKVNQMQPVVEEIISHGRKFNLGIEAGSKPELHAVIAVQCQSDSIIICNGYKDQSYIELALLAQKMGKRIFIVVALSSRNLTNWKSLPRRLRSWVSDPTSVSVSNWLAVVPASGKKAVATPRSSD